MKLIRFSWPIFWTSLGIMLLVKSLLAPLVIYGMLQEALGAGWAGGDTNSSKFILLPVVVIYPSVILIALKVHIALVAVCEIFMTGVYAFVFTIVLFRVFKTPYPKPKNSRQTRIRSENY